MNDDEILNRIRAALAEIPDVTEKKMFGGTAFIVRGKMCVTGRAERIMARIDPDLHDDALKRPGCRTVTMKGREYRGYVHVDAASVQTKKELAYWIDLALQFNEAITSS